MTIKELYLDLFFQWCSYWEKLCLDCGKFYLDWKESNLKILTT